MEIAADDHQVRKKIPSEVPFGHLAIFRPFLGRYPLQIIAAFFALLTSTIALLALGNSIRWLADSAGAPGDSSSFSRGLFAMLPVVAVVAIASAARSYYIHWLGERIAADLRRTLFDHLLTLDPTFFSARHSGELVSRISSDTALVQTVIGSTTSVALRNLFIIVGGLAMMILTSIKLTVIVIVAAPLVVLPSAILGRRVRRLSRQSQDELGQVNAYAQEILASVQTVQAYGQEVASSNKFTAFVERAFKVATSRIEVRASLIGIIVFLSFTLFVLVLWFGGRDVLHADMTAGQLSAFVFYGALVTTSMGTVTEYMTDLRRVAGVANHLSQLLSIRSNINVPAQPKLLPNPARGAVRFENVEFAYESRAVPPILTNFNLRVAPGEKIALVGPSGAGKSTVFQLLLRFYDPSRGRILFDDTDVRMVDPSELRARIGVVAQDPVIFAADAWDNIRFGCAKASREDIRDAARVAGILDFLEQLPDGLSTYLGERGTSLSGGQRQRIAIARAIVRNPTVLLLDEATNSLDAENNQRIGEILANTMIGRTTIIIAHRLATVRRCDRIVVIDEGRIIAEGTHDNLRETCPLYQRLSLLEFEEEGKIAHSARGHAFGRLSSTA